MIYYVWHKLRRPTILELRKSIYFDSESETFIIYNVVVRCPIGMNCIWYLSDGAPRPSAYNDLWTLEERAGDL